VAEQPRVLRLRAAADQLEPFAVPAVRLEDVARAREVGQQAPEEGEARAAVDRTGVRVGLVPACM
jgi:hypothetical protein